MSATWAIDNPAEIKATKWGPMVGISLLFHLAVFSLFLFVPESFPTRRPASGIVYEVNLVELPAGGEKKTQPAPPPKSQKSKPIIKRDTKAKRITVPKKKKKPLIIAKRTVKRKPTKAKKPKITPSQRIDRTISKIERRVKAEEKSKSQLDKALSDIKSRIGSGVGAGGREGLPLTGMPMQIYQLEVEMWIKGNWSYPVASKGNENLEAIVVLKVNRDGAILKTKFKKQSASGLFDESVSRAIEKSDPLPPFPEGYRKTYDEIEINFNLRDLE